ncbi:MAG: C-terminus family protein [candidate division TM6 bacterium GW2011_GWE2_31_21]|nr:MAG: C-terminus family protein [candidate division TM6 bacterium GW2011_GWE2_31_21]KKP54077.1 MAG: C-terminus family protein [candidate division TM6 bacterium GW2011_GWF2_33_332]
MNLFKKTALVGLLLSSTSLIHALSELDENLLFAAARGDVQEVRASLTKKANVKAKGYENYTALLRATRNDRTECALILIEAESDVNAQTKNMTDTSAARIGIYTVYGEYAPLHFAAMNGNARLINALIKKDANVNVQDANGNTPLHYAAQKGYVNCINKLLNAGAKINIKNNNKNTALMEAAKAGQPDSIEAFLTLWKDNKIQLSEKELKAAFALATPECKTVFARYGITNIKNPKGIPLQKEIPLQRIRHYNLDEENPKTK